MPGPLGLLVMLAVWAVVAVLTVNWWSLDGSPSLSASPRGRDVLQKELLDRQGAVLRNMTIRVQTAEQALVELRQQHLELKQKQDEELSKRRSDKALAKRGGGAPAPAKPPESPAVPAPAIAEASASESRGESETEEEPSEEELEQQAQEEQRKLINYNEATKSFVRNRPDFKCGSRVPLLPDEEVVECAAMGPTPCCSGLGWCGSTNAHCKCATCIDYRSEPGGAKAR
ncbi:unnamed protein product [Polarella glacialis]|uniref:Uncharacterized protein n=1 Tax=Polarella glacialis TaxID=89957 RepID=A0A813GIH0_POLGL|nr:unnamed protein product [Polarella glacialis]